MSLLDLLRPGGPAPDTEAGEVLWLGEPGADDPARVGGKAASLSRLAARWPVPPGFCLTVAVQRRLAGAGSRRVPAALRRLVAGPYRELAALTGSRRPAVAVRSSAVDEDGTQASFAGQHDTVLNAVGVRAVAAGVVTCWESAHSDRARTYRAARGLAGPGGVAVLVQTLVDAEVAVVAFSADPVTGDRGQVVINASFGLGEAVVAGTVTPDTYRLSRDPLEVTAREVADKDLMVVCGRGGTREVTVPPDRRSRPCLTTAQCREVGRLALDLEEEAGRPVDLECAYQRGSLFLLQCRPITSL